MTTLAALRAHLAPASIPSPNFDSVDIGPFSFRMYGLMIALGVIAAVWLIAKRFEAEGGDPEWASTIAIVAVPAGLVGSRLYHVVTDWRSFEGRWVDAFKIWEGGLGIPGGIIAGVLAGWLVTRRRQIPFRAALDACAAGIPLAQAIGRWGNWFNQELYGRPTDLPWALEIDPENRVADHLDEATFHPTFLYESLWNVGVVLLVLAVARARILRRGRLFFVYMAAYAAGRLWIEALRVDTASEILGLRVNLWTMGVVLIVGLIGIMTGRRGDEDRDEPFGDELDETEESGEAGLTDEEGRGAVR